MNSVSRSLLNQAKQSKHSKEKSSGLPQERCPTRFLIVDFEVFKSIWDKVTFFLSQIPKSWWVRSPFKNICSDDPHKRGSDVKPQCKCYNDVRPSVRRRPFLSAHTWENVLVLRVSAIAGTAQWMLNLGRAAWQTGDTAADLFSDSRLTHLASDRAH